jgi:hypothetical protein
MFSNKFRINKTFILVTIVMLILTFSKFTPSTLGANLLETKNSYLKFLSDKNRNDIYSEIKLLDINKIDCSSTINSSETIKVCDHRSPHQISFKIPIYRLKLSVQSQLCIDSYYKDNPTCNTDILQDLFLKFSHLHEVSINNIIIEIQTPSIVQFFTCENGEIKEVKKGSKESGNEAVTWPLKIKPSKIRSSQGISIHWSSKKDDETTRLIAEIKKIINKYYNSDKNTTYRTTSADRYIGLTIEKLKNKVLENNYWERLEINIFLYPDPNEEAFMINSVLDGQYASGIFPPKSRDLYHDMEPAYSQQLLEHLQKLLSIIGKELN